MMSLRRWLIALHVNFILLGGSWGALLTRIPTIRDELGLSLTELSIIVFVASVGVIVSLGLTGRMEGVIGAKKLLLIGMLLTAVGLPAGSWFLMNGQMLPAYVFLAIYGMGFGVGDIANNVSGSRAEQASKRPRMSLIHAGFSIGGILSVLTGAWAEAANLDVVTHHFITGLLVGVGGLLTNRWVMSESRPGILRRIKERRERSARSAAASRILRPAWRDPRVLMLGFIALAGSLADGVGGDWMPLAFIDEYGLGNDQGVLVLALMFGSTLVIRLIGDRLVSRLGRVRTLRLTFALGVTGVLLVSLSPFTWLAIPGALLWGAGDALAFPAAVSAAADDPTRAARNVSTVSAIAYTAYIGGPVLFGILGDAFGLRTAFLLLAAIILMALFATRAAKEEPSIDQSAETP